MKPRKYTFKRFNKLTGNYYELLSSELTVSKHINEIYSLSKTFKTSPGRMTKECYLNSEQPTIKYLFKETKLVKEMALRLWFDFDGSIAPNFKLKRKLDKKNGKIYKYFQIQFECEISIAETNPKLASELVRLCEMIGIKARLKNDKRKWSGIDGVSISSLESVKKFVKLGPVTDVIISSKSNRFNDLQKKHVCKAVDTILTNNKIPRSKYFKDKESAMKYRDYLNSLLMNEIKIAKSPVV